MSSNHITAYYGSIVGSEGIEMDLEVKSEPESDDDNISTSESTVSPYSTTSSVQEIQEVDQFATTLICDDECDELEDEPEVSGTCKLML